MTRIALFLIAVCTLAPSAAAQPGLRKAPEFTIHRPGEPDLKLSAYRGKPVILALLNTGCTHCQHFVQQLAVYQKEYGPKGLQVLAAVFNQEAQAELTVFRTKYVQGFPVGYSDTAAVIAWVGPTIEQGYFVPIVAFVNRAGMIESIHTGDDNLFQDPDANIRRKVEKMLKGPGR